MDTPVHTLSVCVLIRASVVQITGINKDGRRVSTPSHCIKRKPKWPHVVMSAVATDRINRSSTHLHQKMKPALFPGMTHIVTVHTLPAHLTVNVLLAFEPLRVGESLVLLLRSSADLSRVLLLSVGSEPLSKVSASCLRVRVQGKTCLTLWREVRQQRLDCFTGENNDSG